MIVCTEHDVDVEGTGSVHGHSVVWTGWCTEDGGHEVEVVEQ